MTREFVSGSPGKVDGEVPIPVSEGIGVIVNRYGEAQTLEPRDRASHIGDLEIGSNPVTNHFPVMSCSWPIRCPSSPARQLWQMGRSGCDRNLTHQSTDVEQQAHTTATAVMVDGRMVNKSWEAPEPLHEPDLSGEG